jgi:hypothetical protein
MAQQYAYKFIIPLCYLIFSVNISAAEVRVEPLCNFSNNQLTIHTVISYKSIEKPNAKTYRELWSISCSEKTKECSSAAIDLNIIENSKPLRVFDFFKPVNMRIVSIQEKVFTLDWGPSRRYIVDLSQNKVFYKGSTEIENYIGEGACN